MNAKSSVSETPLHIAAKGGFVEIVKYLLSSGADVNAKGRGRDTPLHIAAKGGVEIVKHLLSSGADVSAKRWGKTPLDYARDESIKKILRDAGGRG